MSNQWNFPSYPNNQEGSMPYPDSNRMPGGYPTSANDLNSNQGYPPSDNVSSMPSYPHPGFPPQNYSNSESDDTSRVYAATNSVGMNHGMNFIGNQIGVGQRGFVPNQPNNNNPTSNYNIPQNSNNKNINNEDYSKSYSNESESGNGDKTSGISSLMNPAKMFKVLDRDGDGNITENGRSSFLIYV
jgi:hypothetical protein